TIGQVGLFAVEDYLELLLGLIIHHFIVRHTGKSSFFCPILRTPIVIRVKLEHMRTLTVFNFMTLNGFYKGPGGDISWNGHRGGEERDFAVDSTRQGALLLLGRVTYELMIQWWPTPAAAAADPEMAEGMNASSKIVFSRTLASAD